jgi:hypothetical protein
VAAFKTVVILHWCLLIEFLNYNQLSKIIAIEKQKHYLFNTKESGFKKKELYLPISSCISRMSITSSHHLKLKMIQGHIG